MRRQQSVAQEVFSALLEAANFLHARDEMNAAIHLTAVRLSPLTIAVDRAIEAMRSPRPPRSRRKGAGK